MSGLIIFAIAFVATLLGVQAFRGWSLRRGMLDIPNDRSSHRTPTPRGGGLIIVLVSLLLYSFITIFLTTNFKWTFLVAAGIVAIVSWLDDLYSIPSLIRLFFHAIAAMILLWGFGDLSELTVPGLDLTISLGGFGAALAFIWIVWMINAYNFMDGIDGLAASQAVLAGFAWCIFGYAFGYASVYYFGGVLAFSSLGFLLHNWSPAKIFMGDIGSSFLGLTFASIPLIAAVERKEDAGLLLPAAAAFLWFFVFDAAFTRLRRLLRGENVLAPHREHIYQRMVVSGRTHASVTLHYAGLTCLVTLCFFNWVAFRGSWGYLTLLSMVLLPLLIVFTAAEKKIDVSVGK